MIELNEKDRRYGSSSSKGNQMKWYKDGYWYKADYFGGECLAEELVSQVLSNSNLNPKSYIIYDRCKIYDSVAQRERVVSRSRNFCGPGYSILTFERALSRVNFTVNKHESGAQKLFKMVQFLKEYYGVDVTEYLRTILTLDYATLDEDRHLNNLALLYDVVSNRYELAPLFDYGGSLLSDVTDYNDIHDVARVKAKPFNTDFKKQVQILGANMLVNRAALSAQLEQYPKSLQVAALRWCVRTHSDVYI